MDDVAKLLLAGLVSGLSSGTVLAVIVNTVLKERTTRIEQDIKAHFDRTMEVFRATRQWKEQALTELLGPLYMQFDRTKRAFDRWKSKDNYLEAKVIREGNLAIRDLLLGKGHLVPQDLLNDAGRLVEHYDRWLEEFEIQRVGANPNTEVAFIFTGDFPRESEQKFKTAFTALWKDLYGTT
jgi:hypothetical protein